jgi:hypothetical protein
MGLLETVGSRAVVDGHRAERIGETELAERDRERESWSSPGRNSRLSGFLQIDQEAGPKLKVHGPMAITSFSLRVGPAKRQSRIARETGSPSWASVVLRVRNSPAGPAAVRRIPGATTTLP